MKLNTTAILASLAAACLGLAAHTASSNARPAALASEQPNPFDFIKKSLPQPVQKGIDIGEGAGKMLESVNLANDQQVQQSVGESVALGALSRWPLSKDENLNKYITMVGLALADKCDDPGRNFQFGLLDTEEANAFATPHGVILITRGAIRLMQDESELAGVLAHEMTHVLKQHGLQSVANGKFASGALQTATAAAGGIPALGAFNLFTDQMIDVVIVKGYDKGSELEADRSAVTLTKAVGYDPAGLRRFLERLEAKEGNKGAGSPFSTHPGHQERIGKLKDIDGGGGNTMLFRFISTVN